MAYCRLRVKGRLLYLEPYRAAVRDHHWQPDLHPQSRICRPPLINRMIRLAAFQNPEFYAAQAMRLSTFDKARIIACAENFSQHIGLPRGCLDTTLDIFQITWHSGRGRRSTAVRQQTRRLRLSASCCRSRRKPSRRYYPTTPAFWRQRRLSVKQSWPRIWSRSAKPTPSFWFIANNWQNNGMRVCKRFLISIRR